MGSKILQSTLEKVLVASHAHTPSQAEVRSCLISTNWEEFLVTSHNHTFPKAKVIPELSPIDKLPLIPPRILKSDLQKNLRARLIAGELNH
jgi:hypothetical protein